MNRSKIIYILILLTFAIVSCKDSSVDPKSETLIYQYDGLIENIGGDCSAVQVRTRSLDTFDLTNSDKLRFNFESMSDADLSSLLIFYINENDEQINLVNLPDRESINNTRTIETDSPRSNAELFSRVTLRSSVCTGHIYYLTFRDLKIYSITQ